MSKGNAELCSELLAPRTSVAVRKGSIYSHIPFNAIRVVIRVTIRVTLRVHVLWP